MDILESYRAAVRRLREMARRARGERARRLREMARGIADAGRDRERDGEHGPDPIR